MKKKYDVIVVGSGPAGATVARELSRSHKNINILLIEKGRNHRMLGHYLSAFLIIDRHGFLRSREGLPVTRAITLEGSSVISYGTSFRHPLDIFKRAGSSMKIMEAGNELGYEFTRTSKFIDPTRCAPGCSLCIFGCKREAKWTARSFVEEARDRGVSILTGFTVTSAIVNRNEVIGVRGHGRGVKELFADVVVISAGGLGTPVILQGSGIKSAGNELFCDPFVITYGFNRKADMRKVMPMAVSSSSFYDDGWLLFTSVDPFVSFVLGTLREKSFQIRKLLRYPNIMGIMTKIRDENTGRIHPDGTFSKGIKSRDRSRLDQGSTIAQRILEKAGCDPDLIFTTMPKGSHPGGTCAIGRVVDKNMETGIKNLYACDASVIPESPGVPLIITCVALGKRLSRRILGLF